MDNPVQDRQVIKARMEAIAQRNPAYSDVCELVGGLLLQTLESGQEPGSPGPQPQAHPAELHKGRSLWDRASLELDWPRAWDLAGRLAQSVEKRPGGTQAAQAMAKLRAAAGGDGREAGAFRAVLTADQPALSRLAEEHDGEAQVLGLLLRLALRPLLLAAAQAARQEVDLGEWSFGHCPVCGSAPGLAELSGEGGKRTLHCSLCETAWPYPRLQCPFCESQEPGTLSYLKAKEEEGLQVDVCANCGQYLKTLDLRELAGPIILPLDDAATWHLDLIAREHLAAAS